MVEEVFKHGSTEWEVLKSAPILAVILFVVAFVIAVVVVRRFSSARSRELQKQLTAMSERLAAKDAQLAEYRQRLHLASTDLRVYSGLSNPDLKGTALKWVSDVREFLVNDDETPGPACDQLKANAIVLRDELLSRLPTYARDDRWFSFYERVENTAAMAVVADDLQRLADSLSG